MSVEVAKLAGFCFGVKRAVDTVDTLSSSTDANIYTLGKLIHNETVISRLEKRGIRAISTDEIEDIASSTNEQNKSVIVIRAHGVVKEISDKLNAISSSNTFFTVSDCTCPLVKKIHNIVAEHSSDNTFTLIFGDREHPEVQGICSYVNGPYQVFLDTAELDLDFLSSKAVIMVSQTTQKLSKWKKSQEIIQNVCTKLQIFDTICSVTENRQKEVDSLSGKCDIMLVIGGKESSNTNKLYEVAKAHQPNTFLIEDADGIPPLHITSHTRVGIAAGASTPGDIIKEVETSMSENTQTNDIMEEDFEALLNESSKTIKNGDRVTGTVLSVNGNEVQLDLHANVTGIIQASDIIDPTLKLTDVYHVGDEVEAIAVRVSDLDGTATLSRKRIEAAGKWQAIVDAFNAGEILEGKITGAVKGGVIIMLNSTRVFIPASQTGLGRDEDPATLVGTMQKVKIIEVNEQRKRAVASIRIIAREERKAAEADFWASMEEGKTFTGRVKSITSYGAFVDLGPLDGMVHTTELSWKRIKSPADVVSVGDTIDVFVKSFDQEKRRISLGYKTEATNPWTLFTAQYAVGDVANVKIVSLMPFGAFAEIIPGADGLIHISHISKEKIGNPAEVLKVGDKVDVKIIDIDNENQRISLSMKALVEDEEDAAVPEEIVEEVVVDEAPAQEAPVEETPAE